MLPMPKYMRVDYACSNERHGYLVNEGYDEVKLLIFK